MSKFDENDCRFIGTIGKDIDVKYSGSGTAIANFSIACGKSVKKGDEWENKTEWIPICCFGKTAEYLSKNVGKGSVVRVIGEYVTNNYTNDAGVKIYKTQITASAVKIISGKTEVQQDSQEDLPADGSSEQLPF